MLITYIESSIISTSPLFIGDDEGNLLIDNERNMVYLPATSIAGAFRSYLQSIGEDESVLFGDSDKPQRINIYIQDSYADIKKFTRRVGLRIDYETGANVPGQKIERLYFDKGLEFKLRFKVESDNENNVEFKKMIYKGLKGLDDSIIRFGGYKSSGLGIFKVKNATEMTYNLSDLDELTSYLKEEDKEKIDIINEIDKMQNNVGYVKFRMSGNLSTPLIIKAPKSFYPSEADDSSLKNGGNEYLIPGSSFKGILRSRVETIANYFGSEDEAKMLFGGIERDGEDNVLSRIFVEESIVDNSKFLEEVRYNRIRLDKFTSGVRYGSLMQDIPVKGGTEFNIIYRKSGDKGIDNYAIGIIILALRDLGTENLSIGGSSSIGRGRFRADILEIEEGEDRIEIDFNNKITTNDSILLGYIRSVKNLSNRGDK
ncbi:RAMP superfamily CRISPR-associated protein [Paratissierella segnis]|jgi:CRISPR/Cas system CSM-associated protein Csm3 (group 7 of RAMP superfamily)|uniref:CRISPR type III-associated protein domain-containing protein n=1 Tax=Paratissierella segnis TaxID=2763679 RepID=A0A926ESX8_9FIRM|nr:RAMP superfamily CRISPR-associated protein [Paratissierella segnis]MBC8587633.1 hypothetical protein [Paratissierella segnis]